jgi:hypothetical protein
MMPKIAEGDANKVWVIPSEITKALEGLGSSIHEIAGIPQDATPRKRVDMGSSEPQLAGPPGDRELSNANEAVQEAIAAARSAANPGRGDKEPTAGTSPADDQPEDPSPGAASTT